MLMDSFMESICAEALAPPDEELSKQSAHRNGAWILPCNRFAVSFQWAANVVHSQEHDKIMRYRKLLAIPSDIAIDQFVCRAWMILLDESIQ